MSGVLSYQDFQDRSPRHHQIMRVIFFIATCSWSLNTLDDYADSGLSAAKIGMRVLPLMLVTIYVFFGPYKRFIGQAKRPILWALWFYVIIGSICGLVGIMPLLSLWKGIEIIVTIFWVSICCHDADSSRRELRTWLWYIEILLYWTLFLALINPSRGFQGSYTALPWLRGYLPMINPNGLSALANFVLVALIFLPARYKVIRISIVGLILLLAQSRTQYTAFAAVIFIIILDSIKTRKIGRVLILSGLLSLFILMSLGVLDRLIALFMRGQTSESMASLSGRTEYWGTALRHAKLFGGGLATGSRSLIYLEQEVFRNNAVNLHSTYFETILGAGYVAAIPFLLCLVGNIFRQYYRFLVRRGIMEGFLAGLGTILAARSIMSISLAIFCTDFYVLILFWVYLSHTAREKKVFLPPPKPNVRRFLDTEPGSDVSSGSDLEAEPLSPSLAKVHDGNRNPNA